MKYKNVKTNNFVETDGIIHGELWELVESSKKEPAEETESVEPQNQKEKQERKRNK